MNIKSSALYSIFVAAFVVAGLAPVAVQAKDAKLVHVAGPYRVELDLLKAEPFGAPAGGMGMGGGRAGMMMIVKGGAMPVAPDAPSHPNHHLVVHVMDAASGKALTHATVHLAFTPVDAGGNAIGKTTRVPVVVMEASGMGAASTHYGNNVTMPPGTYRVDVLVNGTETVFRVNG